MNPIKNNSNDKIRLFSFFLSTFLSPSHSFYSLAIENTEQIGSIKLILFGPFVRSFYCSFLHYFFVQLSHAMLVCVCFRIRHIIMNRTLSIIMGKCCFAHFQISIYIWRKKKKPATMQMIKHHSNLSLRARDGFA